MKMLVINTLMISILFIANSFAQWNYVFNELKGIEENSGNTVLFYRLFDRNEGPGYHSEENSIYRYNQNTGNEILFLFDFDHSDFAGWDSRTIHNFDFWNNNPNEYIFCYSGAPELGAIIKRFDDQFGNLVNGYNYTNAGISKQDDSLVFGLGIYLNKSTDGGWNWEELPLENFLFVALNPFDDQVLFGQNNSGELKKSNDGGHSSYIVDTTSSLIYYGRGYNANQIEFDRDTTHIYRVYQNLNQYSFTVSNNKGEPFSWSVKYFSDNKIFISLDYSQSGSIYLADGRYIYHSTDYGSTFYEYKVLDRKIVGIYKKPSAGGGSDKLYAATKYDLYEITPDTIITIKHLTPDPDIFKWFPLEVGNKWVYKEVNCYDDVFPNCLERISTVEVTRDTIFVNNKKYFFIESNGWRLHWDYLRLDSSNGKIYRYDLYDLYPGDEFIINDILAEPGDTLKGSLFFGNLTPTIYNREEELLLWGEPKIKKIYSDSSYLPLVYTLTENLGLDSVSYFYVGGNYLLILKGAIINGIIYGDTTTVGVNDHENTVQEFSLSQNYPNPFNPITSIEYRVASIEKVTLKVYDVLGREVVTLVNEEKQPGVYEVEFDGSSLSSGTYFYRLSAGEYSKTKKLLLIK